MARSSAPPFLPRGAARPGQVTDPAGLNRKQALRAIGCPAVLKNELVSTQELSLTKQAAGLRQATLLRRAGWLGSAEGREGEGELTSVDAPLPSISSVAQDHSLLPRPAPPTAEPPTVPPCQRRRPLPRLSIPAPLPSPARFPQFHNLILAPLPSRALLQPPPRRPQCPLSRPYPSKVLQKPSNTPPVPPHLISNSKSPFPFPAPGSLRPSPDTNSRPHPLAPPRPRPHHSPTRPSLPPPARRLLRWARQRGVV